MKAFGDLMVGRGGTRSPRASRTSPSSPSPVSCAPTSMPRAEADFFQSGDEYVAGSLRHDPRERGPALRAADGARVRMRRRTAAHSVRAARGESHRRRHLAGDARDGATSRRRAGVRNVELLTAEQFESDTRTFDLVNCFLVLQRLRRAEGLELLRKLVRRVREGGVGVFHFPYRAHVSPLVSRCAKARARVPGVNAVVNVAAPQAGVDAADREQHVRPQRSARGAAGAHFDAPHLVFTRHGDLDGVIVHASASGAARSGARAARKTAKPAAPQRRRSSTCGSSSRVRRSKSSIARPRSTSRRSTDWEHHLAKPFAMPTDSPQLLINLGTVLQGLQLAPGMTVLEYGAGTGWLSRYLTQLGCRMILLDVAPTALDDRARAVREAAGHRRASRAAIPRVRRTPHRSAGCERRSHPLLRLLPSRAESRRGAARVRPRAEAARHRRVSRSRGREHSKTPQSQYEMRTYGVVEKRTSTSTRSGRPPNALGFVDLQARGVQHPAVPRLARRDTTTCSRRGGALAAGPRRRARSSTTCATFFLTKPGARSGQPPHGRTARRDRGDARTARAASRSRARDRAQHGQSEMARLERAARRRRPRLCICTTRTAGSCNLDCARAELPRPLDPGKEVDVRHSTFPPLEPGTLDLELDCVAEQGRVVRADGIDADADRADVYRERATAGVSPGRSPARARARPRDPRRALPEQRPVNADRALEDPQRREEHRRSGKNGAAPALPRNASATDANAIMPA